jgi:hypothetical protein
VVLLPNAVKRRECKPLHHSADYGDKGHLRELYGLWWKGSGFESGEWRGYCFAWMEDDKRQK